MKKRKQSVSNKIAEKPKINKRLNPRKVWTPRDQLAPLGYYTAPVQKVVRRWRAEIGEDIFEANIKNLMTACNFQVKCNDPCAPFFYEKRFALEVALAVENVRHAWRGKIDDKILGIMLEHYTTPLLKSVAGLGSHLDPIFKTHRLFILELLLAVDNVFNGPDSLPGWILKLGFAGDERDYENGKPMLRPWPKILEMIKASGGPKNITSYAISQAAKRMHLTE
jgi:hypothetical protein